MKFPHAHTGTLAMNIQDTIEQALASAGLDTRSGPMQGVTETIRQALASAGLGAGASSVPSARAANDDEARTFDVEARELGAVPVRPAAKPGPRAQGQFLTRSHTGPARSAGLCSDLPAAGPVPRAVVCRRGIPPPHPRRPPTPTTMAASTLPVGGLMDLR